MPKRSLDFTINPDIFKALMKIQKVLPLQATDEHGESSGHDNPAGLALLGLRNGEVDTVVSLKMSGGCWDAPHISYTDMDIGFHELISKDRICCGMALIRNPRWHTFKDSNDGRISETLRHQLHSLRKSFDDIKRTVWIVLHNDYFRVYRPYYGKSNIISAKEVNAENLFTEESKKEDFIKQKLIKDKDIRIARAKELIARRKFLSEQRKSKIKLIKAEEEKQRLAREAVEKARIATEKARKIAEAKADRAKRISKKIEDKLREGKDSIIDAGGGYCYIWDKNSKKYIFWRNDTSLR